MFVFIIGDRSDENVQSGRVKHLKLRWTVSAKSLRQVDSTRGLEFSGLFASQCFRGDLEHRS